MCNYAMYKEIERERRRMERREGEVERNWGVEGGGLRQRSWGVMSIKRRAFCVLVLFTARKRL